MKLFGKPEEATFWEQQAAEIQANADAHYRAAQDRMKALNDDLEAIEAPEALYQVRKDFVTGAFGVWKWSKELRAGGYAAFVFSGYELLQADLRTVKSAEAWLKAHLDPTTNEINYGADGKRLEGAA